MRPEVIDISGTTSVIASGPVYHVCIDATRYLETYSRRSHDYMSRLLNESNVDSAEMLMND